MCGIYVIMLCVVAWDAPLTVKAAIYYCNRINQTLKMNFVVNRSKSDQLFIGVMELGAA